jgi:hypothetical protein
MKEIPTALELYYETENRLQVQMSMMDVNFNEEDIIRRAMIDYAKFHVVAALNAASENVEIEDIEWGIVDEDSILSAYPLDKIK